MVKMIYILTQLSNTECTECGAQDVEIIAIRSSVKEGLEAIKKYEKEKSNWRRFELTGYEVGADPLKSKTIASLDRRVNTSTRRIEWTLWVAEEYKKGDK